MIFRPRTYLSAIRQRIAQPRSMLVLGLVGLFAVAMMLLGETPGWLLTLHTVTYLSMIAESIWRMRRR
jgi:hypothetical protein